MLPKVYFQASLLKGSDPDEASGLMKKVSGDIFSRYVPILNALFGFAQQEVIQDKFNCRLTCFRGEWLVPDNNPKVPYELRNHLKSIMIINIEEAIDEIKRKVGYG